MGVVIEDGDPKTPGRAVRGRDRHVVQVAKPAAVVGSRVVARRAYERDRGPTVTDRRPHRPQDRPGRQGGDLERPRMDGGLRIEESVAQIPEVLDVRRPMDPLGFLARRGRRGFDAGVEALPPRRSTIARSRSGRSTWFGDTT